jgi:hypothetical protein
MQVLPLTEYVFNTEAHPLPIFGSETELSHRAWYLKHGQCPLDAPVEGLPGENESTGDSRVQKHSLQVTLTWLNAWKP